MQIPAALASARAGGVLHVPLRPRLVCAEGAENGRGRRVVWLEVRGGGGERGKAALKEERCRLSSVSCFVSRRVLSAWVFVDSWNGLGWKGPERSSHSNPLPRAGTPSVRSGCSKPHQTWLYLQRSTKI